MKVFVFDLLAYGENLDHIKQGQELPYRGRRSIGWVTTAWGSTSITARPTG